MCGNAFSRLHERRGARIFIHIWDIHIGCGRLQCVLIVNSNQCGSRWWHLLLGLHHHIRIYMHIYTNPNPTYSPFILTKGAVAVVCFAFQSEVIYAHYNHKNLVFQWFRNWVDCGGVEKPNKTKQKNNKRLLSIRYENGSVIDSQWTMADEDSSVKRGV